MVLFSSKTSNIAVEIKRQSRFDSIQSFGLAKPSKGREIGDGCPIGQLGNQAKCQLA